MQDISLGDLLVSPGVYALGVALYFATQLVRRIVENIWPNLRAVKKPEAGQKLIDGKYRTFPSLWWNTVILYTLAPALGTLAGFSPLPFVFADLPRGARQLVGLVVGFFCALLFKGAKRVYEQRAGKISKQEVS